MTDALQFSSFVLPKATPLVFPRKVKLMLDKF